MSRKIRKAEVMERLRDVAFGKPNDVVRLAFTENGRRGEALSGLDLMLLSEVKCSSGGVVEIKLANRVELIKLLLGELKTEESRTEGIKSFFEAMDKAAGGIPEEKP